MAGPNHTEDETKKALSRVESIFCRCIRRSHREYQTDYTPKQRLIHSKSARARIIYDHTRALLDQKLAKISGVRILTHRGLTMVVLDDEYLIKAPKKLSRRLLSRTYLTGQTLDFLNHDDSQGQFPFLLNRMSLIVGYLPGLLDSDTPEIWATCPDGPKRNFFKFELRDKGAAGTGAITPPSSLPSTPFADDAEEQQRGKE